MAVYFATKAYGLRFGEAIGYELRRTGVTVTTLCPGGTATEFADAAGNSSSRIFNGFIPVMRAEDVARRGYRALKAGRLIVVVGAINKMMALSSRFLPLPVVLAVASRLNSVK
jgi:short-subunit dehydrogenase